MVAPYHLAPKHGRQFLSQRARLERVRMSARIGIAPAGHSKYPGRERQDRRRPNQRAVHRRRIPSKETQRE